MKAAGLNAREKLKAMNSAPKNSISLIRNSHMPKVAASRWRASLDPRLAQRVWSDANGAGRVSHGRSLPPAAKRSGARAASTGRACGSGAVSGS